MKVMRNQTHIEGYLYSHTLELKVSKNNSKNPGTEYISGTVDIATDNALLNIVSVHFTYVTAKTAKGSPNATFETLNNIISGTIKSVTAHGADVGGKIRIDSSIGLNDFYSDRSGVDELVSAKRNEGGFVHTATTIAEDEKTRNTFECDMVITGVRHVEADEDRNLPDKTIVKGYVFDFRNAVLPVEFSAVAPGAMNYFESLEPTPNRPVFTKVWGRQISEVVVRKIVEESAFGEDSVREVNSSRKDWVITGASKEPYAWNDEETITADELKNAEAERETYLATIKQRRDEYRASQAGASTPAAASGGFNF